MMHARMLVARQTDRQTNATNTAFFLAYCRSINCDQHKTACSAQRRARENVHNHTLTPHPVEPRTQLRCHVGATRPEDRKPLSPHTRGRWATTSSNHVCAGRSVQSQTLPPQPKTPFAAQSKWRWWKDEGRG